MGNSIGIEFTMAGNARQQFLKPRELLASALSDGILSIVIATPDRFKQKIASPIPREALDGSGNMTDYCGRIGTRTPDLYCVILKPHFPKLPILPFCVFLLRF
jgi:hypothetical protein